jgi:thiamine biosynthesis lipoprotein ApbE
VLGVIVVLVLIVYALSTPDKPPEPLDKAVDKIFNNLETQARTWGHGNAVQPINDARAQVIKLLRDRKLL